MISTYSWSFDPTPSNKDGIPMVWTTQAWRTARVSGHPLMGAISASGYQDTPLCDCCKDGIRYLFVRIPNDQTRYTKAERKITVTKKSEAAYVYYRKLRQRRNNRR